RERGRAARHGADRATAPYEVEVLRAALSQPKKFVTHLPPRRGRLAFVFSAPVATQVCRTNPIARICNTSTERRNAERTQSQDSAIEIPRTATLSPARSRTA